MQDKLPEVILKSFKFQSKKLSGNPAFNDVF